MKRNETPACVRGNITERRGASKRKDEWFVGVLEGTEHERWLVKVGNEFIGDEFNWFGIIDFENEQDQDAFNALRGKHCGVDFCTDLSSFTKRCLDCYGLIHSRYILTDEGLTKMRARYERGYYGTCPNSTCNKCKLLPASSQNLVGSKAKLFCPCCNHLYPWETHLDGAFFGKWFPHIFFLSFPTCEPLTRFVGAVSPEVYGFDVIPHHHFTRALFNVNNQSVVHESDVNTVNDSKNVTTPQHLQHIINNDVMSDLKLDDNSDSSCVGLAQMRLPQRRFSLVAPPH
ncbi:Casein kinase II subunit beta [Entamoeba marina]